MPDNILGLPLLVKANAPGGSNSAQLTLSDDMQQCDRSADILVQCR